MPGRTGRLRKPTALRLIEGEKNKDRINKNEPKPRPITPDPPAGMDRYASAEWKRMAPILGRLGLLTEVDGAALAAHCKLHSLDIQTSKALKECGDKLLTYKTTVDMDGGTNIEAKVNPLVTLQLKIIAQKRVYLNDFGMNPASRAKISVPGAGENGAYEDLLD